MHNKARLLRNRPTEAEQLIWNHLRMKQMEGLKFRRQQPIDNYIVDFVCFEDRLIIEIDGGQHAENEKDIKRDRYLSKNGFRVLRFWNNDVFKNIEGVLEVIRINCLKSPSPLPPPVKGGGISVDPAPVRKRIRVTGNPQEG
ncbi:MAG: endonuclease domain-containing protein [Nitrospirae bacterium]|nr:endonuclease domain-containing protein [Nitrospirota bacterium]